MTGNADKEGLLRTWYRDQLYLAFRLGWSDLTATDVETLIDDAISAFDEDDTIISEYARMIGGSVNIASYVACLNAGKARKD